jgi:hypothetical protein
MGRGIIRPEIPISVSIEREEDRDINEVSYWKMDEMAPEKQLERVAILCEGMSGRGLRKLPVKAHAFYLQRAVVTLHEYIAALLLTVETNDDSSTIQG